MLGAERMRLEPVEDFFKHMRRNSGSLVGDREKHGAGAAFGQQRDCRAGGREADGIGQKVEENLADAQFVGDKTADIFGRVYVERKARAYQPISARSGASRSGASARRTRRGHGEGAERRAVTR